ncbi:hypothetical protein CDD83_2505 [Cordyceps sp. RAO-2017]|nr:hypothetical protein CDD83_2505 [Cordyceps sp. RAO-2017]
MEMDARLRAPFFTAHKPALSISQPPASFASSERYQSQTFSDAAPPRFVLGYKYPLCLLRADRSMLSSFDHPYNRFLQETTLYSTEKTSAESRTPNMDSFHHSPSEVCLAVLYAAHTREDMVRLSHASPVLLRTRLGFRSFIDDYFFSKTPLSVFTDALVQDAMAILLFPAKSDAKTESAHRACVDMHLKKWAAKDFPDPIREQDIDGMKSLEHLFEQLKRYIDDYLPKATSPDLRQAYIHLPGWSHPCLRTAEFLPPRPSGGPARFDLLSSPEKHRVFKSLPRLEFYSKLYAEDIWGVPCAEGMLMRTRGEPCCSCSWSWEYLNKLQKSAAEPWEIEGIRCVFEYVRCLYGALNARLHPPLETDRARVSWADTWAMWQHDDSTADLLANLSLASFQNYNASSEPPESGGTDACLGHHL